MAGDWTTSADVRVVQAAGEARTHLLVGDDPDEAEDVAACGATVREWVAVGGEDGAPPTLHDLCGECLRVVAEWKEEHP